LAVPNTFCPTCHAALLTTERDFGRVFRCPNCGGRFQVDPGRFTTRPVPPPAPVPPASGRRRALVLATAVLVAVAAVASQLSWYARPYTHPRRKLVEAYLGDAEVRSVLYGPRAPAADGHVRQLVLVGFVESNGAGPPAYRERVLRIVDDQSVEAGEQLDRLVPVAPTLDWSRDPDGSPAHERR
jgi:hypothetical protein